MNNSNNTYNCNNHNNRYNSRYTKGISHISTCTYMFFKPTYVGTLLESIRKPLRICLLALTTALTVTTCKTNGIYRVEYTDGSVEYYDTKPDTANQGNIKSLFEINPDDIGRYEQR